LAKRDEDVEDFILQVTASVEASASSRPKTDKMDCKEVSNELIAATHRRQKQAMQRYKVCQQVTTTPTVDGISLTPNFSVTASTDKQVSADISANLVDCLNASRKQQQTDIEPTEKYITYGFKSELDPHATEFVQRAHKSPLNTKPSWVKNEKTADCSKRNNSSASESNSNIS